MPGLLSTATKDGLLDFGKLYPPLARYCPLTYSKPGLQDNPAQCLFLLLDGDEAFYGGAVGGGKSAALLMAALQYVDVPGYQALILRRTFAQLSKGDALIPLSHRWLAKTDARWVGQPTPKWTFPSGAVIEFGHMQDDRAKYDYQGAAYHFVGFDELTQFPEVDYEYVGLSRTRRTLEMQQAGVPIRVRATGNPGGLGHGWVKKRFIQPDTRPDGVAFIPAKIRDNPGLDADDYERRLTHLSGEWRRKLMDGDWDVFEGAAYPDFDQTVHVIPAGTEPEIPSTWGRFEQMDFGVANPTAWHLLAVDYDGNLLVLDEYYSPGLVSEHAAEILRRRQSWWCAKDEDGRPVNHACFGDPSISARTGGVTKLGDPASVLTEFQDHGVRVAMGNNSRRAGRIRLSELLRVDETRRAPQWASHLEGFGSPRYFVSARCQMLIDQLQTAPLLPIDSGLLDAGEVVDPKWESQWGHAVAAARYGAMSRPGASHEPEPVIEDERAWRIVEHRKRLLADVKGRSRLARAAANW